MPTSNKRFPRCLLGMQPFQDGSKQSAATAMPARTWTPGLHGAAEMKLDGPPRPNGVPARSGSRGRSRTSGRREFAVRRATDLTSPCATRQPKRRKHAATWINASRGSVTAGSASSDIACTRRPRDHDWVETAPIKTAPSATKSATTRNRAWKSKTDFHEPEAFSNQKAGKSLQIEITQLQNLYYQQP